MTSFSELSSEGFCTGRSQVSMGLGPEIIVSFSQEGTLQSAHLLSGKHPQLLTKEEKTFPSFQKYPLDLLRSSERSVNTQLWTNMSSS